VTDTNVFQLSQPGPFADPLTEVLRSGARALLVQAVEAEVESWPHESGQDDKWSFCLTGGTLCPANQERP
jgi:hypothetical protein